MQSVVECEFFFLKPFFVKFKAFHMITAKIINNSSSEMQRGILFKVMCFAHL